MTHEERLQAVDDYFKSPKADEYFAGLARAEKRDEDRIEALNVFQETLSDKELEDLMLKFAIWEAKYQDMYYGRGILTYSSIFTLMFELARKYGTELESQEMFPTESHEFRGYVFNLTHGQGSILWITHNGERLI